MSSNASSSGIESDTDSSPCFADEKDNENNDSIETLIDDDDEGFINTKIDSNPLKSLSDHKKQMNEISTTSKYKSSHYPRSIRNPYDDETNSSSVVEDWDEECKLAEPYYFPGYIRRAQWPNHWRWTPPLGIRRTCTQQLQRNFGFELLSPYDDKYSSYSNITIRHFTIDYR